LCRSNEDWLEALVEHARRKEVGVEAKFFRQYDSTRRVLMGVFAIRGTHSNTFRQMSEHTVISICRTLFEIRARDGGVHDDAARGFWEVGGFEEIHLAVAFQDVDLSENERKRL
jgi:hypothetical protein